MVTRRKAIPASVREEVVRTYGRACWLRFPDCTESRDMTLDHLYPDRLGGSDTVRNLRPACRHCNSARHDRLVQGAESRSPSIWPAHTNWIHTRRPVRSCWIGGSCMARCPYGRTCRGR